MGHQHKNIMQLAWCIPRSRPLKYQILHWVFLPFMDGPKGLREKKDVSGVRAIRESFLKEVQFELGVKGWGGFWSSGWKKGRYCGCGDMVRTGLEPGAVLINVAVSQYPVHVKSTQASPHKVIFYFCFYYHHHIPISWMWSRNWERLCDVPKATQLVIGAGFESDPKSYPLLSKPSVAAIVVLLGLWLQERTCCSAVGVPSFRAASYQIHPHIWAKALHFWGRPRPGDRVGRRD